MEIETTTPRRRTYRIVAVADFQPGDIMKTNRQARVDHIETHENGIAVHWANGRVGVFHATQKLGIYR